MNQVNQPSGRWRNWYEDIADWMIQHPGGLAKECAKDLNKHPVTISMIVGSDLFKAYYAKRRAEWRERHDHALINKLTNLAEASLDLLLIQLEKKKDQVPIQLVTEMATSALDRLGYSPQRNGGPALQVNVNGAQTVQVAVSTEQLEEAREALRVAERNRASTSQRILEALPGDTKPLPLSEDEVVCSRLPHEALPQDLKEDSEDDPLPRLSDA